MSNQPQGAGRQRAAPKSNLEFPREFKKSGFEQIDWKLTGFGCCVFVLTFGFIAFCAYYIEEPEPNAEAIAALQQRVARVAMPDVIEPPPPPPEPEVIDEEPEVVEDEVAVADAPPPPSNEDRQAARSEARQAARQSRADARSSRSEQRQALAAATAQQGTWAMLTSNRGGSGGVAANFGAAGDLEQNINQVGGVKRGGTSSFDGSGTGVAAGEGAIVGPGGGRSSREGGSGIGVDALLGQGGIGGGDATSLGGDGPAGSVDIAAVEVAGDADAASSAERSDVAIQAIMRQNLGPIQFCYQREQKLNPNLQGSIKVRLTIESSGRVTKVDIVNDTMNNRNLTRCVQGRIRAWRFKPVASGTSIVNITLPFAPA